MSNNVNTFEHKIDNDGFGIIGIELVVVNFGFKDLALRFIKFEQRDD